MKGKSQSGKTDKQITCEIIVEGALDRRWQEWFGGMTITVLENGTPAPLTVMRGKVADQSALYGILCQIMNLNLPLISLRRLNEKGKRHRTTDSRNGIVHYSGR